MPDEQGRYLAIAPEPEDTYNVLGTDASPDTGALPTPVIAVDASGYDVDPPSDAEIRPDSLFSRAPNARRGGEYMPQGSAATRVDTHSLLWWLRLALGEYQFTSEGGDTIPDTDPAEQFHLHEFWPTEGIWLPSFVVFGAKDLYELQTAGATVSQLQLAVSRNEMATLDVQVRGARDTKTDTRLSTMTGLLPDAADAAFQDVTVKIGGEAEAVEQLQLTIANNLDEASPFALGSRFGQRRPQIQGLDVQFQFTLKHDTAQHLERLWGSADGPTKEGAAEFPVEIEIGPPDGSKVVFDLPRCAYETVPTQVQGRQRITNQVQGRAYRDTITLDDNTEHDAAMLATVHSETDEITIPESGS